MRSFNAGEIAEVWGVIKRLGNDHRGLSGGRGSIETVSNPAPAIQPSVRPIEKKVAIALNVNTQY